MKIIYKSLIVIFLILNILGCNRVSCIEEHSDLTLPNKYKEISSIENTSGFAGQDITLTIILEFEKIEFDNLLDQIEKKENYEIGIDSIILAYEKKWVDYDTIMIYANEISHSESIQIEINKKKRQLKYLFVHI